MDRDLHNMLRLAMRYALGRMTYVVDEVCMVIERHADAIDYNELRAMRGEICKAIDDGKAGMDMDVERWQQCSDKIAEAMERRKDEATP